VSKHGKLNTFRRPEEMRGDARFVPIIQKKLLREKSSDQFTSTDTCLNTEDAGKYPGHPHK
jgi:hypothetical protein